MMNQPLKSFEELGIRIEDDVVVTESGHQVLTYEAPKEIDEVESIVRFWVLRN